VLKSYDEKREPAMKPSEALTAHRDELRQLVSRYSVAHPRVYGSVLTGKDDDESDLDLLVDATERTTLFTLAGLASFCRETRKSLLYSDLTVFPGDGSRLPLFCFLLIDEST
jgi:predicted nucleotidyltransferase